MRNLRDMTYDELLEAVQAFGEKPYRAEQLFGWVYKKLAPDIDSMTDVSKAFRERLKGEFVVSGSKVLDIKRSPDGAQKFLSELEDGSRIESVIIPETGRLTLCVSTQAGCALGCRFCMTGKSGFTRNLTLSELVNQVVSANEILGKDARITNIVLMGMGEPLNNYDNVLKFTQVLTDGRGFGFSHNRVTLSTSGVVPGIKRLGAESNVSLAVSLNATTDEVRTKLMPINKKYPIADLLEALRAYPFKGKRHITIEYVLIKGLNDTLADSKRLAVLLRGIPCKINLIPFNPFPGSQFERPQNASVMAFGKVLRDAGYMVMIRMSKGAEIEAACGQLRARYDGA
ncbi:MAG: 23S rRNA (adenine(2503)-C(2))-methyltransferase RlmN [Deltaproteobacteria bacterium]|nr:23S rRNA (adenine(2503)-C(2))-methyltransferase RlmN [Deltaproteobacteria bacterium]